MDLRAEVETLPEAGRLLVPLCDTLSNTGAAVLKKINDMECLNNLDQKAVAQIPPAHFMHEYVLE